MWGLSGRLIASYILVTVAVVVLVEALALGFQVPSLVNGTQLQSQVDAAARSYGQQLSQRYPGGVPAGTVLGIPGQPAQPGLARLAPGGTLDVPAITGPVRSHLAVTAVVAIAADGTVVASSAPSRYPAGRAAGSELPVQAAVAIAAGPVNMYFKSGSVGTVYGSVLMTVWSAGRAGHQQAGQRAGACRLCLRPDAMVASVHQPHPRLGRAGSAWRGWPAAVGSICATARYRAGRRALWAAGLTPPRPPGAPPGASRRRGR